MIVLGPKDLYFVKRKSLIADYDRETIFNLYQPIIGHQAVSLYVTLFYEAKNQRLLGSLTHEDLLVRTQMSTQEFLKARGCLESVGLIKTYLENLPDDVKFYHYELYAPKTPNSFFDNPLLYGTLIKFIGEQSAYRLKNLYNEDTKESPGTEISKTFGEEFRPDLDDEVFTKTLSKSSNNRGRKTAKIDSEFNYQRFFESLTSISQISSDSFTKKELKNIERLCALYGIDEVSAANVINHVYDAMQPKGSRIDFTRLSELLQNEVNFSFLGLKNHTSASQVSSDSDLANKINMMESIPPKRFLSILQNGSTPASSDLRLLEDLSIKFALPPGVINALIDYVLVVNDNVLSRSYVEKIAASLAREGITSVLDAMNYLKKVKNKRSKKKGYNEEVTKTETSSVKQEEQEESKESDDVSWDDLLKDLNGGSDDGEN